MRLTLLTREVWFAAALLLYPRTPGRIGAERRTGNPRSASPPRRAETSIPAAENSRAVRSGCDDSAPRSVTAILTSATVPRSAPAAISFLHVNTVNPFRLHTTAGSPSLSQRRCIFLDSPRHSPPPPLFDTPNPPAPLEERGDRKILVTSIFLIADRLPGIHLGASACCQLGEGANPR